MSNNTISKIDGTLISAKCLAEFLGVPEFEAVKIARELGAETIVGKKHYYDKAIIAEECANAYSNAIDDDEVDQIMEIHGCDLTVDDMPSAFYAGVLYAYRKIGTEWKDDITRELYDYIWDEIFDFIGKYYDAETEEWEQTDDYKENWKEEFDEEEEGEETDNE